jgi:hypothetical protein
MKALSGRAREAGRIRQTFGTARVLTEEEALRIKEDREMKE